MTARAELPEKIERMLERALVARAVSAVGVGPESVRKSKFRASRKRREELRLAILEALDEAGKAHRESCFCPCHGPEE